MITTAFRPLLAVLAVAALALGLAACGGSSSDSSTADTASVIGGGTATCDQATFDAWVKAYGEQADVGGATLAKDAFTCADGWAVLNPTVGTDGDNGFDDTVIVQAEGPNWALMDRAKACGASEAESEVPKALYALACQAD